MEIKLSDHFTYGKLFRFCLSPVIMMVFTSVYGVVDGLFVSNFVGKTPFAAINLIMPFIMILGGIGFMFGTGGSALVAKTLGEGKPQRANQYFSMLVYATVFSGFIMSAIGIAFVRPISRLLGATPEMLEDCVLYARIVLAFNMAYMLQNVFQSFLITAQKPKLGLWVTVAAGVTNMVLDAVFIGVFKWGVAGAAIATGLSQFVGGVLPLVYFMRPNDSLLRLVRTMPKLKVITMASVNGSSELMTNISASLVSMLYNFQLMKYAGENGVAAYGVLMYIQFIFIGVFFGYAIGSAPIISYHYGAQNNSELKNLLKKSLWLMSMSGIAMMLLAVLLSSPLAKIFVGYDAELFDMTHHAFKLFAFSFVLAGINIFASSFFTALNNGAVSAIISFLRTLVFQMLSVLALPLIFGINGIWLSNAVAEFFAFVVSVSFIAAKRNKYHYL